MSLSRNHKKKSSKNRKKEVKQDKFFLANETTSTGIIFRKRIDTTITSTTDLKSLPHGIVIGFSGKKENIFIDYSNVTDEEDLNNISIFFSNMEQGEVFTIKNAEYLDERYAINTKTLEGDFKFLNYVNNSQIMAEKIKSMGDFYEKMFNGKFFIKTIQYEKTGEMKSLKKTSKIINYVSKPKFKDLNIQSGDILEFSGTRHNNIKVTVLSHKSYNDGREELTVTEVADDETRMGEITKIKHYKQKSMSSTKPPTNGIVTPRETNRTTSRRTTGRTSMSSQMDQSPSPSPSPRSTPSY